jgi:hypothetical protein
MAEQKVITTKIPCPLCFKPLKSQRMESYASTGNYISYCDCGYSNCNINYNVF